MLEDMQHVLYCRRTVGDRTYTIRFIKAERRYYSELANYVCSSDLREAMSSNNGKYLRETLDAMALSPEILWYLRDQWITTATAKQNDIVMIKYDKLDVTDDEGREKVKMQELEENSSKRRHDQISDEQRSTSQAEDEVDAEGQARTKRRKLSIDNGIPQQTADNSHIASDLAKGRNNPEPTYLESLLLPSTDMTQMHNAPSAQEADAERPAQIEDHVEMEKAIETDNQAEKAELVQTEKPAEVMEPVQRDNQVEGEQLIKTENSIEQEEPIETEKQINGILIEADRPKLHEPEAESSTRNAEKHAEPMVEMEEQAIHVLPAANEPKQADKQKENSEPNKEAHTTPPAKEANQTIDFPPEAGQPQPDDFHVEATQANTLKEDETGK